MNRPLTAGVTTPANGIFRALSDASRSQHRTSPRAKNTPHPPSSVNSQLVATVTTNGAGFVELQHRTAAFIDEPDDGIPMPSSFPSLKAGDDVTIGTMTTTPEND